MMAKIQSLFFRYIVFYGVLLIRGEWIWPYKRELEKSQFFSMDKIHNLQKSKFETLLKKSKEAKFYRASPYDIKINSVEDIASVPIISKDDVRRYGNDFVIKKYSPFFTEKVSGGSTGAPIKIRKPAKAMAKEYAAAWRGCGWAGVKIGDLQIRFWGVPLVNNSMVRSKIIDIVTRRIRFSAFRFKEKDLDVYSEIISKKKNYYLYGYASMIYEMALHILKNNTKLAMPPKCVFVTSEVLTPTIRESISSAFQCKVFNEYGCGEVGTIAHECDYGSLHVNVENLIVEVVDNEGMPVPEGVVGRLVVTDLNNTLMPLIRYNLEDFGSVSRSDCKCGRTLPILNNLKGRAYDFIENENHEKFHGEFFLYIVEDLSKSGITVNAIQFVRKKNELEVRLSVDPQQFEKASAFINKRLRSDFSSQISVNVVWVDSVSRERSGKLRVIKNEV